MTDDEIAYAVIHDFENPHRPVQVVEDHANIKHENEDEPIAAFAKLAGNGWTYFFKDITHVRIGRPAEREFEGGEKEQDVDESDESYVHVNLGPDKVISRQHAEIFFRDDGTWVIHVLGRNGVTIDEEKIHRGQQVELTSGKVIEIGKVKMMFMLPTATPQIHPQYLQAAGLIQSGEHGSPFEANGISSGTVSSGGRSLGVPLAPAPPDYTRPGTPPPSIRGRGSLPAQAYTPAGNNGTIMVSNGQVDLSLSENEHIKPNFSYAQMIGQAILSSENKSLTLNGIYNYIMDKYAFYRRVEHRSGWQNSIRHNLSLSNSYEKMPREEGQRGKGSNWQIKADEMENVLKSVYKGGRGGQRNSSVPTSPGELIMESNRKSMAMGMGDAPSSALRGLPLHTSPMRNPYASSVAYTPDRAGQLPPPISHHDLPGLGDGSPLPRNRRQNGTAFGLSDNIQGSPPVLSSSFLNTDEPGSFVTPAPARVHPRLAPPSTAQRPSQHMPTSSPAPFWKYADLGTGNTPMRGMGIDTSPIKGGNVLEAPMLTAGAASSSPPSVRAEGSPSRTAAVNRVRMDELPDEEEDKGFDLTR